MTRLAAQINTEIASRYATRVKPVSLRRAARATLQQQAVTGPVELTVVVTGNPQLRALNREFRHVDTATDVLSFAVDDVLVEPNPHRVAGLSPGQRAAPRYLGDVIISFPMAHMQAKGGGHPITAELQLLVVHGVLHLLGHDHATRAGKSKMWQAQSEILQSIGAAITGPNE